MRSRRSVCLPGVPPVVLPVPADCVPAAGVPVVY